MTKTMIELPKTKATIKYFCWNYKDFLFKK